MPIGQQGQQGQHEHYGMEYFFTFSFSTKILLLIKKMIPKVPELQYF